jgi:cation transport regulator ChaC
VLYFAYGSNLLRERFEQRVGRVATPRRAILTGYRFAFNKSSTGGEIHGNIVADSGSIVRGVVYECTPDQFAPLDRIEWGYLRVTVTVHTEDGAGLDAETYIATGDSVAPDGRLDPEYLGTITRGAREQGLPEEYVRGIEALGARLVREETAR